VYKVIVKNECNCFKKSGLQNNLTFENREDAHMKAKVMECKMNQEFCFKHYFEAVDMGDEIVIHSTLRPEDSEDDDIDLKKLLSKNTVQIHFDASEETPSGKGGCRS
jgi:hypothetical protein